MTIREYVQHAILWFEADPMRVGLFLVGLVIGSSILGAFVSALKK